VIYVKKTTALSLAILILLLALTGCVGNGSMEESQYSGGARTANINGDDLDENTSSIRCAAVPAVFVNDTYFRIYTDEQHHSIPDLDDTWVYLGNILNSVPGWESPTQNFQSNNEAMIGAQIYHSSGGRIPVTNSAWGDPLEEEVIGDSVIVIFEGSWLWYISEETHSEVIEVMNAVVRHSLMIDGFIYSLMATAGGEDFSLSDNHVFLGEVASAVSLYEYPTENLQANRDIVVGAKVYRLPSGESSDIVVFFDAYARFYYKQLPGVFVNSSEYQNAERVDLGCCVTDIVVLKQALVGVNSATHVNNDFIMTLNTDSHIYSPTDVIRIWGTLEYTGDNNSVEIWHSCPFMIFSIAGGNELDFGSVMSGFRVDILVTSVLKKDGVYHFEYQKSGGWSADDPNVEYWENFFNEKDLVLPVGEYTITLNGDFGFSERVTDSASGLSAELSFVVSQ